MSTRPCAACGSLMEGAAGYMRLCRPCFSTAKKRELTDLQTEVAELRVEVEELRARPVLDAALLRKLVQLVHPDRHGGSALSTATTQTLLKMRARCVQ